MINIPIHVHKSTEKKHHNAFKCLKTLCIDKTLTAKLCKTAVFFQRGHVSLKTALKYKHLSIQKQKKKKDFFSQLFKTRTEDLQWSDALRILQNLYNKQTAWARTEICSACQCATAKRLRDRSPGSKVAAMHFYRPPHSVAKCYRTYCPANYPQSAPLAYWTNSVTLSRTHLGRTQASHGKRRKRKQTNNANKRPKLPIRTLNYQCNAELSVQTKIRQPEVSSKFSNCTTNDLVHPSLLHLV